MGWQKTGKLKNLEKGTFCFLRNKDILNLCVRGYILRSYCFVDEVTFKPNGVATKMIPLRGFFNVTWQLHHITLSSSSGTGFSIIPGTKEASSNLHLSSFESGYFPWVCSTLEAANIPSMHKKWSFSLYGCLQ